MNQTLTNMVLALWKVDTINPHHPEVNQLNHTVQVTLHALARLPEVEPAHRDAFVQAAILHDVGKYTAMERNGTTHGHEADSVAMIREHVSDDVVWLVENHIRIMHLAEMRPAKRARLTSDPRFATLVILRECDRAGRKPFFVIDERILNIFLSVLDEFLV